MTAVARRTRVEVVDGNSPAELAANAESVREALDAAGGGFVVTVGGDCGVELAPVAEAVRRFGERLVVLWFDAHGDLNTPASSPSGAFHGMVLRALTGEGHAELVPALGVAAGRVVLAGARDLDLGETSFIEAAGVRHLTVGDLTAGSGGGSAVLGDAIASAAGDAVVYVHVDLDVLEPSVFGAVGSPAPGGLLPEQLLELVRSVAGRFRVVGLGITEYEPGRVEDRELLGPLVEALVKVCAS
ncbi:arginase family protein [Nonomuraea sp. NPDC050556]|uniref:arginase family protein n=1 Tax=Nonomuraea sp. NPDC050556 TaxID=3364369 RepID=UPI0037B89C5E